MLKETNETDTVRISKDILDKIRYVSKQKGQTISGYISVNLSKQIEKDWKKFNYDKKDSI
jgi:predicted DNA-binding protein